MRSPRVGSTEKPLASMRQGETMCVGRSSGPSVASWPMMSRGANASGATASPSTSVITTSGGAPGGPGCTSTASSCDASSRASTVFARGSSVPFCRAAVAASVRYRSRLAASDAPSLAGIAGCESSTGANGSAVP